MPSFSLAVVTSSEALPKWSDIHSHGFKLGFNILAHLLAVGADCCAIGEIVEYIEIESTPNQSKALWGRLLKIQAGYSELLVTFGSISAMTVACVSVNTSTVPRARTLVCTLKFQILLILLTPLITV